MRRFTGELMQDDERSRVPMLFDGWGYVPLDASANAGVPGEVPPAEQADAKPAGANPSETA